MFKKYEEMLEASANDDGVSLAMKADGLSVEQRNAAWAVIKPEKLVHVVWSYSAPQNYTWETQHIQLKAQVFSDRHEARRQVEIEQDSPGRSAWSRLCKNTPEAIQAKISQNASETAYHHRSYKNTNAVVAVVRA